MKRKKKKTEVILLFCSFDLFDLCSTTEYIYIFVQIGCFSSVFRSLWYDALTILEFIFYFFSFLFLASFYWYMLLYICVLIAQSREKKKCKTLYRTRLCWIFFFIFFIYQFVALDLFPLFPYQDRTEWMSESKKIQFSVSIFILFSFISLICLNVKKKNAFAKKSSTRIVCSGSRHNNNN